MSPVFLLNQNKYSDTVYEPQNGGSMISEEIRDLFQQGPISTNVLVRRLGLKRSQARMTIHELVDGGQIRLLSNPSRSETRDEMLYALPTN